MALKRRTGGDFAPSWQPEEGDTIDGIVTALSEREKNGQNGPVTYPIATIRVVEDGELTKKEVAIHGASKVLADFLYGDEGNPAIEEGDRVEITYDGERKSKAGFRYFAYTCAAEPADEVPAELKAALAGEAKVTEARAEAQGRPF